MRTFVAAVTAAVVTGVVAAVVVPPAGPAAAAGTGFGYVWANQPTTASYTPPAPYSVNSTGATNRVLRLSTGRYEVELPNLGVSGGVSHAAAYGSTTNTCQIAYRHWSGGTMRLRVHCYAVGVAADTPFTATFTNAPSSPSLAYLFADRPDLASYVPNPVFQHHPAGLLSTVERLGTGYYQVQVPNLFGAGYVQVTAYGTSARRCVTSSWTNTGYPAFHRVIFVRCANALGSPADAMFELTSVDSDGFLTAGPAGNVRVDPHPAPVGPYPPTRSHNSAGGANEVTQLSTGVFRVAMPGLPLERGTAVATALSFGGQRCNVTFWNPSGVVVRCRDSAGALVDSPFSLSFQG